MLLDLKKRNPGATIRIAGKEEPVFAAADEVHALDWLVKNFGKPPSATGVEAAIWAMNGGNPARNAVSPGSMPLLHRAWQAPPNASTPQAGKAMVNAQQDSFDRNQPAIPVAQPLAVGDYVLMRIPSALWGVDFTHGKLEWRAGPPLQQASERTPTGGIVCANGMIFNAQDSYDRLWENATYSSLSSDGDYVFEVEELPDPSGVRELQQRRMFIGPGGWSAGQRIIRPTNWRPTISTLRARSSGRWGARRKTTKSSRSSPALLPGTAAAPLGTAVCLG